VAGAGAGLEGHAERLRGSRRFSDVAVGWLRGHPSPEEAMARLAARRVIVAPMLMSDGLLVRQELPSRLSAADREIRFCPPLGVAPQLAALLRRRALAACDAAGIAGAAVMALLVGHGSPSDPASSLATRVQADRLMALGPFRAVSSAFLDEAPRLADVAAEADGPIVVLGFFAASGRHSAIDVPRAMAGLGRRWPLLYAGAIGDDPSVTDIVLDQAAAVAAGFSFDLAG
jgi:sirohydrochlorin ferrochelatase